MTIYEIIDKVNEANRALNMLGYRVVNVCKCVTRSRISSYNPTSYDMLETWLKSTVSLSAYYTIINHQFEIISNDNHHNARGVCIIDNDTRFEIDILIS